MVQAGRLPVDEVRLSQGATPTGACYARLSPVRRAGGVHSGDSICPPEVHF